MSTPMGVRTFLVMAGAAVFASACASNTPRVRVLPPNPAPAAGAAIARTAETLVGSPYREGGTLPDGFDCSGLVTYVFARNGIAVPRDVKRLSAEGVTVARGEVAPGDLVFFATSGSAPTHVGIAIGGGRFIHAPKTGDVVRIESLGSPYWAARLVAVRRVAGSMRNYDSESNDPWARVLPGPFPFVLG